MYMYSVTTQHGQWDHHKDGNYCNMVLAPQRILSTELFKCYANLYQCVLEYTIQKYGNHVV